MNKVISTEKIPIKLWLDDIEDSALEQAKNLANLPFAFKHISIMPDAHMGYGMPIGGVMATKGVVVPNAVGVDIGCGMCTVRTELMLDRKTVKMDVLKNIMSEIRKAIPVGFSKHSKMQDTRLMPNTTLTNIPVVNREFGNACKSLGTLGGGNHFIELQIGSDGYLWIMIHSGSRNLGKQVADYYNKIAMVINEKWSSSVPREWQLAFLPIDSEEGQTYLKEMWYCVDFALANRKLMMNRIIEIIHENTMNVHNKPMINIAHNYAAMENHFGKNVMIHRKGATLARENTIGIIPGSQGTSSYIVKGKGNPESFMSCSHGAGRKMGRKQAQRELNLEEEKSRLDEQGIIHSIRSEKDLDEASGAYKDISVVMNNQNDLVEIVTELKPLAVIKG